jgi:hypothetical protein
VTAAWKDLELRVCRALGGERAGPTGKGSDCTKDVPYTVQVKRSRRLGPPVLSKWIQQARDDARREKKPWLVVVAGHNDRKPIIAMDFWSYVADRNELLRLRQLLVMPDEGRMLQEDGGDP